MCEAGTIQEQTFETTVAGDLQACPYSVDQAHHASAGGDDASHKELAMEPIGIIPFQQSDVPFLCQCNYRASVESHPTLPIVQRVLDIRIVVPSASDSEGGAIRLGCESEVVGGRWLLLSAESAKHRQQHQHQKECVSL